MKRVFCGLLVVLFFGCGGSAIRDKEVYKAELGFLESASAEQVENGIALLKSVCVCERVGSLPPQFIHKECLELAQTISVVKVRMKYHLDFMAYLGGITEKRPPKTPPDVPDANELCGEVK